MMKTMKLFCSFLALSAAVLVSSCDDEKTNIGGGGSVPVADGFYVAKVGVNPKVSDQLLVEGVEDGFGAKDREGFYATYIFLEAGNYNLVSVIDQEIAKIFGGVAIEKTDDESTACANTDYFLIEEIAEDGTALSIAESGLYKVAFDNTLQELWAYKVDEVQVVGAATPGDWAGTEAQQMPLIGSASATSVKYELTNLVMKKGDYKVRFDCQWTLDRTIAPNTPENGYKSFLNIGQKDGEQSSTPAGNFSIPYSQDGKYTVKVEWTPSQGLLVTVTKTEAIEFTPFVYTDYAWGIIGQAVNPADANGDGTPDGWQQSTDPKVTYISLVGDLYKWEAQFALSAGEFKFRTNDSWTFNKGFGDFTLAGPDAALLTNAGGNFKIDAGGTYKFTITTSNYGDSWTLTVDKI